MGRHGLCWGFSVFIFACSLSAATGPAYAAITFTVTDLGSLGGANNAAFAINNAGQIVGRSQTAAGPSHPFLWNNGTMVDLFTYCIDCTSNSAGSALAINSRGEVAGEGSLFPTAFVQAFLYQNSALNWIPTIPNRGIMSSGIGINDQTVVVGLGHDIGSIGGIGCPNSCAMISNAGSMPQVIVSDYSFANGINNSGEVTGGFQSGVACSSGNAFRWRGGVYTPLGVLPGDNQAIGLAINDRGQAFGQVVGLSASCVGGYLVSIRAATWRGGTGVPPIDLGALDATPRFYRATGISTYGEIIGTIEWVEGTLTRHNSFVAFAPASGNPVMADLGSLSGRADLQVWGINDSGVIVGSAGGRAVRLDPILAVTANTTRARNCPTATTVLNVLGAAAASTGQAWADLFHDPPMVAEHAAHQATELGELYNAKLDCGDPFDGEFRTVFTPQFQTIPAVSASSCIPSALVPTINQALDDQGRAISYLQAMKVTLNRTQSAFTMDDSTSFAMQDQALGGYADAAVSRLDAASAGLRSIASAFRGTACDVALAVAQAQAFLADVQARGVAALPAREVEVFNLFGIDPGIFLVNIVGLDPAQLAVAPSDILTMAADAITALANLYR